MLINFYKFCIDCLCTIFFCKWIFFKLNTFLFNFVWFISNIALT